MPPALPLSPEPALRPSAAPPVVGVVMGSRSDWDTMERAAHILTEFGVPHECEVVSAHRTPDKLFDFLVAKICDQLGIDSGLMQRWGEGEEAGG